MQFGVAVQAVDGAGVGADVGVVGGQRVGHDARGGLAVGHGGGDDQLGEVVSERGEGEVVEVDQRDALLGEQDVPHVSVLVDRCW